MEKQAQQRKGPDKTTAVLVWLLVILVLGLIVAGGLYAREYLHRSFLAVAVEQPDPERNEHVVQVTPSPEVQDMTAAPVIETPSPTSQPSPTPSPEPTAVPTPTPTLNPMNGDVIGTGMRSPIVVDIQIRLMTLEYLDFEQPEDVYGAGVANAMAIFQRRNDLPETGLCDEATFVKLNDSKAALYAVLPGDKGVEVESIQERLIELGYLEIQADGVFGDETAQAVQRFRNLNKLGDGTSVDSTVLEALFGDEPVANSLRIGDKSDQILTWQQRLLDLGYLVSKPDGTYGKLTALAVKRFQEDNGLVADGNLGLSTAAALSGENATTHVFQVGDKGDDVLALQKLLQKYGYLNNNQLSGNFKSGTENGVKEFQGRNGLEVDGKAGAETLKKLLSGDVKAALVTPKPTPKPTPKTTAKVTPKATAKPSSGGSSGGGSDSTPTTKPTVKPADLPSGGYGSGVEGFIAAAESRLGCPYVRGAKGPNSFDCSGFVYWCLKQAGVNVSYMTSVRWRTCSKFTRITDINDVQRGDVLVFSGSSESTGHVGIALGNGRMIDAGSSAGCVVTRSSIFTSYWKSHFLMAYRIW